MRVKGFGVVVLAGILVAGCADTSLRVVKRVPSPPKVVSLSLNNADANMLEEEILGLKQILSSELEGEGIKVTANQKNVVSLVGHIKHYDSGNRALRCFVGYGAGRAAYESNWRLISAAGKEIGNCNIDGWLAMGFFGGSISSMHGDMAGALANCVKGKD